MRIAVSGTHCMGKSTLIQDFIELYPHYRCEIEAYYKLQEVKTMEVAQTPTFESLVEQLDFSIHQIHQNAQESLVIFDRCPIDYIAYAMLEAAYDEIDIHQTEIADRFPEVKEALNLLDLIIFIPMHRAYPIAYHEENPEYRKEADHCFKRIYRDDVCDIFPKFNHPRIVEVFGDRKKRIQTLKLYL
ncbi:MAG TPA: AAA family ATPase [Gammaproteobacteria bacterium]|nr:AAA family ATPase [Gammaproteobacteria bacterium]